MGLHSKVTALAEALEKSSEDLQARYISLTPTEVTDALEQCAGALRRWAQDAVADEVPPPAPGAPRGLW